ncbi:uncharacterized protein N7498_011006 [Penicillium cinerascens]|uniref:HD domain-containing protein n=1 Tax=Penicillium cinerascens TaxID=70096 RepID=A0A9W9J9Y7_9EURO|nr:uncharacterized protein N7498_011006 [Penicillium cinerascens]KAJ5192021.1 hypothetical protein N7498_011006 [Penicillium cinerascens]
MKPLVASIRESSRLAKFILMILYWWTMVTSEKKFAHGQVGKKTLGPVLGNLYIKTLPHLAPTDLSQFSRLFKVSPTLFRSAHKPHSLIAKSNSIMESPSSSTTSSAKAESLIGALEQYGQGDYIGESISQLEHCLQAAHQARKSGARDELVIAALLHDIGQIIPLESVEEVRMNLRGSTENVGRVGHEAIGAAYLRSLGFSEPVCRLVNSHVAAKRYLTAVDRAYHGSLSSASQKSLAFQGGPFEGSELREFEQDPLRDEMVALRLWDDGAKLVGVESTTPRARSYLDMITAHLCQQTTAAE